MGTACQFVAHLPKPSPLHSLLPSPLRSDLTAVTEMDRIFIALHVVACEPRRAKFVVELSRMIWAIGCNDVSIHDAIVSARAGYVCKSTQF